MSTKENKDLIRQTITEWNAINGDIAKIRALYDKYYAPDFIYHNDFSGDMNREQTIKSMVMYLSAFPDLNYSIDDICADGEKTAIRCTMQATHKGTFMGIPATGRRIVVKGIEIDKFTRGEIVEAWGFSDSKSIMTQLGINSSGARKTRRLNLPFSIF